MNTRFSDSGPGSRLVQLTGLTLLSLLLFSLLTVIVTGGELESIHSLKLAQLLQKQARNKRRLRSEHSLLLKATGA